MTNGSGGGSGSGGGDDDDDEKGRARSSRPAPPPQVFRKGDRLEEEDLKDAGGGGSDAGDRRRRLIRSSSIDDCRGPNRCRPSNTSFPSSRRLAKAAAMAEAEATAAAEGGRQREGATGEQQLRLQRPGRPTAVRRKSFDDAGDLLAMMESPWMGDLLPSGSLDKGEMEGLELSRVSDPHESTIRQEIARRRASQSDVMMDVVASATATAAVSLSSCMSEPGGDGDGDGAGVDAGKGTSTVMVRHARPPPSFLSQASSQRSLGSFGPHIAASSEHPQRQASYRHSRAGSSGGGGISLDDLDADAAAGGAVQGWRQGQQQLQQQQQHHHQSIREWLTNNMGEEVEVEIEMPLRDEFERMLRGGPGERRGVRRGGHGGGGGSPTSSFHGSGTSDEWVLRQGFDAADAASRTSSRDLNCQIENAWDDMEMDERFRSLFLDSGGMGGGRGRGSLLGRLRGSLIGGALSDSWGGVGSGGSGGGNSSGNGGGIGIGIGSVMGARTASTDDRYGLGGHTNYRNSAVSRIRASFVKAIETAAIAAASAVPSPARDADGGRRGNDEDGGQEELSVDQLRGAVKDDDRYHRSIRVMPRIRSGKDGDADYDMNVSDMSLDQIVYDHGGDDDGDGDGYGYDDDDYAMADRIGSYPGAGGARRTIGTAVARCGEKAFPCDSRTFRIGVCTMIALSAIVAGILGGEGIGVGEGRWTIVGGPDHRSSTTSTTTTNAKVDANTPPPPRDTSRLDAIRSLLISRNVSSPELLGANPIPSVRTAQRKALEWISYDDTFLAEVEFSEQRGGEEEGGDGGKVSSVVERYALATLFYSTGGQLHGGGGGGGEDIDDSLLDIRRMRQRRTRPRIMKDEDEDEDEKADKLKGESGGGGGGSWVRSDGWLTGVDACEWRGVACGVGGGDINDGDGDKAIIKLDLKSNGLKGTLPVEVATGLTSLEILEVGDNMLNGTLPQEFGLMDRLMVLDMANNAFVGAIPSSLGHMSNLKGLYLSDNLFSGTISSAFGNLLSLRFFALDANTLSGTIPESLGSIGTLSVLSLHENDLSGPIPASITNAPRLTELRLSKNALTGSIPPDIFLKLQSLRTLHLYGNSLTSTIPSRFQMETLTSLKDMQLQDNLLTGTLPMSLGSLGRIETLRLDTNELIGTIPNTMGFMHSIRTLTLHNNRLGGKIPQEFSSEQTGPLEVLSLHHNELTGYLPRMLSTLNDLKSVEVQNNRLEGTVSDWYGHLKKLETFNLHGNSFTGKIPDDICKLTKLKLKSLTADCGDGTVQCHCCHECFEHIALSTRKSPPLP